MGNQRDVTFLVTFEHTMYTFYLLYAVGVALYSDRSASLLIMRFCLNGSTANVALTLLLPHNLQTICFILPELICIPEIMVLMVDSISFSLLSMTITYSP